MGSYGKLAKRALETEMPIMVQIQELIRGAKNAMSLAQRILNGLLMKYLKIIITRFWSYVIKLMLYMMKDPMDANVDLKAIATCYNGYVGADLEALCCEATMYAVKRSSDANECAGMLGVTIEDWKDTRSVGGPSITRGVTVEIPKVTWLGISPVRGFLLHGPPGC